MSDPCPFCGGTGRQKFDIAAEADSAADQLASTAAAIRAACVAMGAPVTADGCIDEATAARMLGKARKTLRNWRHQGRPIPYTVRNRRVQYRIDALANWLAQRNENPRA